MTTIIRPGGEPYLLHRGRLGVVLTHGFTASPAEPRWLGETLAERGYTVYGLRLTGHATDHRDLSRMRWRDWLASTHDGWHILSGLCDRVAFVGHSMGGLLSLRAALDLPCAGVAVLASPMALTRRAQTARWLRFVKPYADATDRTPLPGIAQAEQRRRGEPVRGRIRYDRWSTGAVWQLNLLVTEVRARLPEVQHPLLLVYARHDPTATLDHMAVIADGVGSTDVTQVTLERGGHIVTQDIDRDAAFAAVGTFLGRVLGAP